MSRPTPIIQPRRKVPISRTKVSYFDPSWEVKDDGWTEYRYRHGNDWRPATRRQRVVRHETVAPLVTRIERGGGLLHHHHTAPPLVTTERTVVTSGSGGGHHRSTTAEGMLRDMEREMELQMGRLWGDRQLAVEDGLWEDKFRGFTSLLPVEYKSDVRANKTITNGTSANGATTTTNVNGADNVALALHGDVNRTAGGATFSVSDDQPIKVREDGSREYLLEFDVREFKPDEITVKTENGTLSVHAEQEYEQGARQEYREFARQFVLPRDLDEEKLVSSLSPDGVLTVRAPLPAVKPPTPAIHHTQTRIAIERH